MARRSFTGLDRAARAAADNATALGYVSGWRLVRLLPERTAHRLFARIADEVHRRDGRSVRRLRSNLARVRPELDGAALDELTHRAVRSYLRYWCESFRLPSWPIEDVVRRTRTVNEHVIRDAYARGRGVVSPLPHMGNWDWAGAWACATGLPLVSVAERLRPERLYDEFVSYRRTLGMEIFPAGDPSTFSRLLDWVGEGGLTCLLSDRDLSRGGVEVTLCGHPVRMPRGPAVIAQRTGAALIPITSAYAGEDMELTFHEEIPHAEGESGIVEMMQRVADAFTSALQAHPEDWHMMQRVFVADLGPSRG
ncbi:MAG TPA: phosphatidylinositol mannoside acyltransferase [Nocardioidaceae bacterium]|jgi:KDO2-lipid IV(A) lauroyltransferase